MLLLISTVCDAWRSSREGTRQSLDIELRNLPGIFPLAIPRRAVNLCGARSSGSINRDELKKILEYARVDGVINRFLEIRVDRAKFEIGIS